VWQLIYSGFKCLKGVTKFFNLLNLTKMELKEKYEQIRDYDEVLLEIQENAKKVYSVSDFTNPLIVVGTFELYKIVVRATYSYSSLKFFYDGGYVSDGSHFRKSGFITMQEVINFGIFSAKASLQDFYEKNPSFIED
jgi:hypothetical protein